VKATGLCFTMEYLTKSKYKDVVVPDSSRNNQFDTLLLSVLLGGFGNYEFPISATKKRIHECKTEMIGLTRKCVKCGKEYKTAGHCCIRYCDNCIPSKTTRARHKLEILMRDYPDILSHLILTLPRGRYTKTRKQYLANSKRKFFQNLRRHGIQFKAVGIFDYGNPRTDTALETNIHLHNALNLSYGFYLNPKFLQKLWAKATKIPNAVVKIKKSKKSAVIRYFSKRIAGDYGHGNNQVFFSDFMDVEQYDDLVRNTRYLYASIPKGYSCNRSAELSHKFEAKCQCGGKLRLVAVAYGISFVKMSMDWYPSSAEVISDE
jgi:hypothetical protein